MTDRPIPVIICQVCDQALHRINSADGMGYIHTTLDPGEHAPVPVQAPPGWRGRCDFCTDTVASFVLPARDFTVPYNPNASSLGDWAVCEWCALLINTNRWNTVLARAIAAHERIHGHPATDEHRTRLRSLYRTLRRNITGTLRPIPDQQGDQP